jgi:autotransporter-associated beta strand protein
MGNTPLAGALMNTDITSTSYGSYNTAIATSVYTNGNDASTGLFFGGKYTNEVFNAPVPLYAPSVFAQGSSVSHDNVPSSPTTSIGLMNFNITSSTVRRFQPYEIAMLMDMGWNVYDWNSTTGNWLDGVNNLAASRWTTNQGIVTNTDQSAQYNTHNSTAEAPILPVYGQVTSNIVLNFRGSGTQNYTATNDIGTVRVSRLQLDSSSSNAITIAGGTMNFGQNSDGSASVLVPKIVQQNSGDFLIGSTIQTNNVLTQALVGSVSFPGATGVTVDGTGSGTVTLSGTINGSGTLTKAGTFTLVVSGSSNNYGGTTTVNAGTLLVANTAGSALGSGNVQVNTGATLGGTGAFTGAATISNGGAITAGTTGPSAVRTLGTGPLTLQGKYLVTIFGTGTTDNSRLSVTGDLNLTASTDSLQLSLNGTDVASLRSLGSRSYTVATYTGTLTGNAAIDTLDVTTAGFQSNEWSLTYPANSVVLNFTPSAVPEPGSVFLFGAIGIGIVGSRRTRKWWRIG